MFLFIFIILFSEIAKPPETRKPNSRRDSKKSWNIDNGHDKETDGMKDELSSQDEDDNEDQIDFQSSTSGTCIQQCQNYIFYLSLLIILLKIRT